MAFRYIIAVALVATLASANPNPVIPGSQTAAAIAASSLNGMSRYIAPDGPIVPAIAAGAALPVRGAEIMSNFLSRASSGLNRQAQSLSQMAGQNGQIRMPGLDTAESHMPESIANMGRTMQNAIRKKNSFIRNQADQGIASANRLGQMMSVRASNIMSGPSDMLSSAQEFMSKSASTLQSQASQHLNGAMGRLNGVQGFGRQLIGQAQGLTKTVANEIQNTFGQMQKGGQNVISQVERNHQQNMRSMSGAFDSLQGSMGQTRSNMQTNMNGVMQHAQNTAQQLSSGLQNAAQSVVGVPMKMLSNLQESLGNMMKGASPSSSGGRY